MNLVFWVTVVGDSLKKLELHAFYRTLKIHVAPCSYTHSCTFNRRLDTCIVVSFCTCAPISYQRFCIYLHGMRRQACTTGAGKAAAWQHGRAPNLVIHIPISGCVSRCRIGITPILRLGRRDHDRTRIYNRAIQFPTAATSTAACMHARRSRAQLWPARDKDGVSWRSDLQVSSACSSNNPTEAIRLAGLLAPPPRMQPVQLAFFSLPCIRWGTVRPQLQRQPSTPGQDPNGTVHACRRAE
jgi:hypothetical protein